MSVEIIARPSLSDDAIPRVSQEAVMRVPRAFAVRHNILAYRAEGNDLYILLPNAADENLIDRIRSVTGMRVVPTTAPAEMLRTQIARAYEFADLTQDVEGDAPPAIRAVDEIHEVAVRNGASDIHIEPAHDGGRVRQRVDGILLHTRDVPAHLFAQIVSRVKLLAGMDIADRRHPQDGRYHTTVCERSIDARVSSMPTMSGEKLVIRLLDMHANVPSLEHLGMPAAIMSRYRALVHAPYGFVVVCGPTGSGKTTTLYASMGERNLESQHLCSVEDPVEVRMPGVAQVQVNERAGMTFATALRSFLRQDPNVLMVGEMRDSETARTALSAALSGQLVMTTLHASDASRSIERLVELGLERHAIAAGLSGVLAQRLVRRLCERCRERVTVPLSDSMCLRIPPGAFTYEARGCNACRQTGYRGRTAIFEFLTVTDRVREAIAAGYPSVTIAERGREAGYRVMFEDGVRVALAGETSLRELYRVLSVESFS